MKKVRSLQSSLFFSFATAILVPISIMAIIIVHYLFVNTVEEVTKKNQLLTISVNSQVETHLEQPILILKNLKAMFKKVSQKTPDSIDLMLDSHVKNSELFDAIYILDKNYSILYARFSDDDAEFSNEYIGFNLGHKKFIRAAVNTNEYKWSETFLSMISGKMNVSLALPLPEYVLVADISISHLAKRINSVNVGEDITTTLIDSKGAIIMHPNPDILAQQLMVNNIDLVQKALSGVETSQEFTFNGVKSIGSTKIIDSAGWIILVSQPINVAYKPIYHTLIYLGIAILLSIIMAFIFARFKARQLSKPLHELTIHTQTIAGGDYNFFLPSTDYEEVRDLSYSISQMASAINFREQLLIEGEQKFREVIQATDNLITRIDDQGNFTFVNPAGEKIFGVSIEELQGRSSFEFIHPDDRDRTHMAFEKWQQERRKNVTYENRQISKDGTVTHLLWTINLHYDQNGLMNEASSIAINITDRLKAESQKREFEEHIKHAQKMEAIGTLAGGIAHDFNNILTAIIGYTELTLFTGNPSPDIRENLGEILKASHRAKDLVKQILAFSRKDDSVKKSITLSPLIKESLKMLRASIPTTIDIEQSIPNKCALVLADPTKIHQLIMNLCTNAYHSMRDQGGTLTVTLTETPCSELRSEHSHNLKSETYLKLVISDTGCGIDPIVKEKIFEPFFTTKPQGEGTGMGLSVVHGIVLSHDGHIEVESKPGSGTTFTIYLPGVMADEVDHLDEPEKLFLPGNEHIVVVDDEVSITSFVDRSLSTLDYRITPFNDPEEALNYLKNEANHVDLLLTDMTMPTMNGADLAKAVTVIRPELPIVMITGFSELIDEKKAEDIGIRKYITKPFEIHQITEVIRELVSDT